MKYLVLLALLGACASAPERSGGALEKKTLYGYTISQAKAEMAHVHDPNDITIAYCSTEDGKLVPELNQLRMRLINDFEGRQARKFIHQWNHQTLYPRSK